MDEQRVQTEVQANEQMCAVFDMPVTTTAEQAARLLEEHYTRGYYTSSILEWPGVGMRVFMRRYAKAADKPAKPVAEPSQTKEARAIQFLRENREKPATQLSLALKAIGYPRRPAWIRDKLFEIVRAERRIG